MFPRNGLLIKEMTEAQRKAAHELLKAGLSQRGYMTASSIMDLETVLGALEAAQRAAAAEPPRGTPIVRDPERYFFSVFGTPSAKETWGWRVEGHHVSLHFTVVNGRGRRLAVVLRQQPGRSARGPEEGSADPRHRGRRGPRAARVAGRITADDGDHQCDGARRHADDEQRENRPAVADRASAPARSTTNSANC